MRNKTIGVLGVLSSILFLVVAILAMSGTTFPLWFVAFMALMHSVSDLYFALRRLRDPDYKGPFADEKNTFEVR